jgi:hypothetical protein
VVAVVIWQVVARRRTGRLKGRFGPEYDRTVGRAESRREGEAELREREERRQQLQVEPLVEAARNRYVERWRVVQAEFVDDPRGAVASADSLIQSVMAEQGYPVEDFEQRAADVSVDHQQVVENYRQGHRLAQASANGNGDVSTEDLRQAMRHYRALFDELVELDAAEQAVGEPRTDGNDAERPVVKQTGERKAG